LQKTGISVPYNATNLQAAANTTYLLAAIDAANASVGATNYHGSAYATLQVVDKVAVDYAVNNLLDCSLANFANPESITTSNGNVWDKIATNVYDGCDIYILMSNVSGYRTWDNTINQNKTYNYGALPYRMTAKVPSGRTYARWNSADGVYIETTETATFTPGSVEFGAPNNYGVSQVNFNLTAAKKMWSAKAGDSYPRYWLSDYYGSTTYPGYQIVATNGSMSNGSGNWWWRPVLSVATHRCANVGSKPGKSK
jgi:hypothetical protein